MKATETNLFALREAFAGATEIPNGLIRPTDVPHLKRCLKLGLLELVGPGRRPHSLRLTDAGRKALAGEKLGMRLEVGRRSVYVADFAEASRVYSAQRDESGEGASTFPDGVIFSDAGKRVAVVSYNGKVWRRMGGVEEALLFNPYAQTEGGAA